VLETLRNEVRDFARYNNVITALGNRALEPKHWDKIFTLIGCNNAPPQLNQFNFKFLLDLKIDAEYEKVEEISAFASGEFTINSQLKEISGFWET